jgi:hypothetical protein
VKDAFARTLVLLHRLEIDAVGAVIDLDQHRECVRGAVFRQTGRRCRSDWISGDLNAILVSCRSPAQDVANQHNAVFRF